MKVDIQSCQRFPSSFKVSCATFFANTRSVLCYNRSRHGCTGVHHRVTDRCRCERRTKDFAYESIMWHGVALIRGLEGLIRLLEPVEIRPPTLAAWRKEKYERSIQAQ